MQITYDPQVFPYEKLLDIFWKQIDPTDAGGQFNDRGDSYRTGIYYYTEEQREQAEASKQELAASGRFDKPIVTEIESGEAFLSGRGLSSGLPQDRIRIVTKCTVKAQDAIHLFR